MLLQLQQKPNEGKLVNMKSYFSSILFCKSAVGTTCMSKSEGMTSGSMDDVVAGAIRGVGNNPTPGGGLDSAFTPIFANSLISHESSTLL